MFRLGLVLGLVALGSVPARAQDAIPAETVTAIKRATVFVRVQGTNWKGSGTGFVVSAEKDVLLVVTNHHVVAGPDADRQAKLSPAALAAAVKKSAVTVVFDGGTRTEQAVKAEVVSADPDVDLAVLRVTGVTDPPAPIPYSNPPKLSETMPLYSFGYPFGQALSTTKGSPAVTVGKASVSSLRLDEDGNLTLVQIDGNLNPGNSGGPMVDAKGRLVGVAVSGIRNGQGIGFAIPAGEVAKHLKGRVGGLYLNPTTRDGKTVARVEVCVIDPAASVKSVNLYYLFVPPGTPKPPRGDLTSNPAAKKLVLTSDGWTAAGEIAVDGPLGEIVAQAVPEGGAGADGVSRVRAFNMAAPKPNTTAGPVPMPGTTAGPLPMPGIGASPKVAGRGPRIQGGGRDEEFEDRAPDGGVLAGIEVGVGRFFDKPVVKAVRPVFRVGGKDSVGEWHGPTGNDVVKETVKAVAKPGYAVGAVTVKNGLGLDGLTVTFMKVMDGKLDPTDKYDSEFIGGTGGGRPVSVGGDGTLVIGLIGKSRGDTASGLGLLYKEEPKK